jgi:hypothetical protein
MKGFFTVLQHREVSLHIGEVAKSLTKQEITTTDIESIKSNLITTGIEIKKNDDNTYTVKDSQEKINMALLKIILMQ